jgi:hypothetical protein
MSASRVRSKVDDDIKQALLSRFSAYLDTVEDGPAPPDDPGETADLYSVFVEVAGLRSEVRTESRLVKEALDQFRDVFDLLRTSQTVVQQELDRARAETREKERAALRPLLLDVIDLRDRLVAALKLAATVRPHSLGPIGCCGGSKRRGRVAGWLAHDRAPARPGTARPGHRGDAAGGPTASTRGGRALSHCAGQVRGGGNSHGRGPDRLSLG